MSRSILPLRSSAVLIVVPLVLGTVLLLAGCAPNDDGGADGGAEPDAGIEATDTQEPTGTEEGTATPGDTSSEGAALVQERCTTCHTLDRVQAEDGDVARWTQIVDSMIARGAMLNQAERETVIQYLAETYPDN